VPLITSWPGALLLRNWTIVWHALAACTSSADGGGSELDEQPVSIKTSTTMATIAEVTDPRPLMAEL
jgi:hypothetical protein